MAESITNPPSVPVEEQKFTVFPLRGKWHVQFASLETGRYMTRRCLGIPVSRTYKKSHAEAAATQWYYDGRYQDLVLRTNKRLEAKEPSDPTFREVYKDFFDYDGIYQKSRLRTAKRTSNSSLDPHQSHLRTHILPFFGEMILSKISNDDVNDFHDFLLEKTALSPTTAHHVFTATKLIFSHAFRERKIPADPIEDTAVLKGLSKKRNTLTADELLKLFNSNWSREEYRLFTMTAAITGARRGEILGLKWKNLKLEIHEMIVETSWSEKHGLGTTKTNIVRTVAIPDSLCSAIANWKNNAPTSKPEDFVFGSAKCEDQPMSPTTIGHHFGLALGEIGLHDDQRKERFLSLHSLRHGINTLLINSGVPDIVVRKTLGHAAKDAHEGYFDAQKSREKLRKTLNTLFPKKKIISYDDLRKSFLDSAFE